MSEQASFTLRGRNPDVLTCIANLSNDEVFTPPDLANRMLDKLAEAWAEANDGADIWADSSIRFLDPCTKSGVFLREITSRLTKGLAVRKCRARQCLIDLDHGGGTRGIAVGQDSPLSERNAHHREIVRIDRAVPRIKWPRSPRAGCLIRTAEVETNARR